MHLGQLPQPRTRAEIGACHSHPQEQSHHIFRDDPLPMSRGLSVPFLSGWISLTKLAPQVGGEGIHPRVDSPPRVRGILEG